MSKVIAFTGGCCSGKTTTIQALAKELEAHGKKVVILHENIREHLDNMHMTIDEVRKEHVLYVTLQHIIIEDKIKHATNALYDSSDTIYLEDRFVTDSLYYLTHYCRYCSTVSKLQRDIRNFMHMHKNKYHLFAQFPALYFIDVNDVYRPKDINTQQFIEEKEIHKLNDTFLPEHKVYKANLNEQNLNEVIYDLISLI